MVLLQLSEDVLLKMYKEMVMLCELDQQLFKAPKMVSPVTECHHLTGQVMLVTLAVNSSPTMYELRASSLST